MPSCAAMAPIAQHRGGDAQLACDLDQRPTAARQQGGCLPLELIRKMTPFLTHSTPFRSRRSLAKMSTNSGEAQKLLDGLFYLVRTGCQWRHLPPPPDFPPWRTVYGYMRAFLRDGVWESIRHRFVVLLREGAGREASPSAAVIDTQSVKTTESGGPRGWDAAKRLKGRKRHI